MTAPLRGRPSEVAMMNSEAIVRAWKDPTFRASLSPQEREKATRQPQRPGY